MTGASIPPTDFLHTTLGRTGQQVCRLGLSGSYWPGETALRAGIEAGLNYLFWFYWDRQMTRVLREVLPGRREQFVVATGVSNLGTFLVRKGLETCLRKLRVDHIDVFHLFWVSAGGLGPRMIDLLHQFKEEGKIKSVAISTHARRYAQELIRQGVLDVVMMRYNAAHRGAEVDIFPSLPLSQPGVVSYTATRWGKLLRAPRGWPASGRVPTARECYRFALSNPHVHVCLTAPRSHEELKDNLTALEQGPLSAEDMEFMRSFGDAVRTQSGFLERIFNRF